MGEKKGTNNRKKERRKEERRRKGREKGRMQGRKGANMEKWKDGRIEGQKNRWKKGSK